MFSYLGHEESLKYIAEEAMTQSLMNILGLDENF